MSSVLGPAALHRFFRSVFNDPTLTSGAGHKLLLELGLAAILTTNYDKLIESVFPKWPVYTHEDSSELAHVMRGGGESRRKALWSGAEK